MWKAVDGLGVKTESRSHIENNRKRSDRAGCGERIPSVSSVLEYANTGGRFRLALPMLSTQRFAGIWCTSDVKIAVCTGLAGF